PGQRVYAAHGAHHLGPEYDVADVDDTHQKIDARLVIHARVEEHVLHHVFLERGALEHVGESAVATPVVGNRPAAMRNDEAQRREIPEQTALDELHERGGVGVDVMRAGGVEVRIARGGDVDHGRHIELDHLLVEGVPVPVGEWWGGPVSARRIGIQVAADEIQLAYAALELGGAVGDGHSRG